MTARKTVAIPSAVQVGPVTYRIIMDSAEVKAASDAAFSRGDGEWEAFSDHSKLIIGLNPDHAADKTRVSLVHELLHCVLRQSGSHPSTFADIVYEARDRNQGLTVEEYSVSAMTGPLLSMLRDNPLLAAYLLSS